MGVESVMHKVVRKVGRGAWNRLWGEGRGVVVRKDTW